MKPHTVPVRVMSAATRARQYAKALEDARKWAFEGLLTPEDALSRALQGRGIITAPAPALHPTLALADRPLSEEWRRSARDFYADSRVQVEGGKRAPRQYDATNIPRKKRAQPQPMGRPRGSVGVSRRASNPSWWMGPGGER